MSNITNRLNKVLQTLNTEKVSQVAYKAFVKNTPVRSETLAAKLKKLVIQLMPIIHMHKDWKKVTVNKHLMV